MQLDAPLEFRIEFFIWKFKIARNRQAVATDVRRRISGDQTDFKAAWGCRFRCFRPLTLLGSLTSCHSIGFAILKSAGTSLNFDWVIQRIAGLLCSAIFSPQPNKCVSNIATMLSGSRVTQGSKPETFLETICPY
jgi:hypothetical protein